MPTAAPCSSAPEGHLVLDEADDEELEAEARDLLLLDADNLSHAMRRIDDEFGCLKPSFCPEGRGLGATMGLAAARPRRAPPRMTAGAGF